MPEDLAVAVPATTMWTRPDAPRRVDVPMLADRPDTRAWTAALDDALRRDLLDRSLSQLLLGEPVELLKEDGGWARVIAPWQPSSLDARGYPGWVRRAHLATTSPWSSHEAVITAATAAIFDDAGLTSAAARQRTRPSCPSTIGRAEPSASTCPRAGSAGSTRQRAPSVPLRPTAPPLTLIRAPCRPRLAAHDQAAAATHVPRSEARGGDLYFFARPGRSIHHVGFAFEDPDLILHAPSTGQTVVDEPMNDDSHATITEFAGRFTRR